MCCQGYWTKRDNNSEKQSTVCKISVSSTITNSLSSMYKLCVDPLCRAFLYRGFVFSMNILHIKVVFFVSRVFHHSCRELNVLALIYLRHGKHTNAVWASSSIIIALQSLCFFNLLQNLVCKRKAHFLFCIFFGFLFTHCLIFMYKNVCY
jgi:hypothetical protein